MKPFAPEHLDRPPNTAHQAHGDARDAARPSKSQRKRDADALQQLGAELAELPEARLAALELPDALRAALAELRRTRSHEGRRRQLQYIGKQMRSTDPAPLREAVAAFQLGPAQQALALHEAERWRAALVADDAALTRWAAQFPRSDLQQLRSLVRAARADAQTAPEQRHGRGWRALFRFIRPLLEPDGQTSAEPPTDHEPGDETHDD